MDEITNRLGRMTAQAPMTMPEQRAQEEASDPTLSGVGRGILDNAWVISPASTLFNDDPTIQDFDPDFSLKKLTPDQRHTLFDGLPDNYLNYYEDALSFAHAKKIRERIDTRMQGEAQLANLGVTGVALTLGAALIDPLTLGPEGIAFKLGKFGAMLNAGRGAYGVALGAASGATLGFAGTYAKSRFDPTVTNTDLLTSTALGMGLGALAGPSVVSEARIERQMREMHMAQSLGADAPEEVLKAAKAARDASPVAQHSKDLHELEEELSAPFVDASEVDWTPAELNPRGGRQEILGHPGDPLPEANPSVGAAGAMGMRAARQAEELDATKFADEDLIDGLIADAPHISDVKGDGITMFGRTVKSGNAVAAGVMGRLTPNPSGVYSNGVRSGTAFEHAALEFNVNNGKVRRTMASAFEDWANEAGLSWFQRKWNMEAIEEFNRQIADTVRTGQAANKHVERVASEWRAAADTLRRKAKEAGVEGFENIDANPNYFPRRFRWDSMQAVAAKLGGRDALRDFLAGSLHSNALKNGDTLAPNDAKAIAQVVMDTITKARWGLNKGPGQAELKQTVAATKEALAGRLGERIGLSDDEVEALFTGLFKSGPNGESRVTKRRTGFDEDHVMEMADGTPVRFSDLLENDFGLVSSQYMREVSGMIGMARMGFKAEKDWEQAMDAVRAHHSAIYQDLNQRSGLERRSGSDLDGLLENLNITRNLIMGHAPTANRGNHKLNEAMRLIRNYNFARLMGVSGFAQFSEASNIIGAVGMQTVVDMVPSLGGIIKRARDGLLTEAHQREIEDMLAPGMDDLLHDPFGRLGEFGEPDAEGLRNLNHKLSLINRGVANLSGLLPVTIALERMAVRAAIQHLADHAAGRATYKGMASAERLASIGIGPEMAQRVYQHLRPKDQGGKVDFVPGGLTGKVKVNRLNMADWDPEVAMAFSLGLQRFVRRAIQKSDPGDIPKVMTSEIGKFIFHLRHFTMVSYAKQLLHGARMQDAQTGISFLSSMGLGALAYSSMVAAGSIGRPDADEYRARRLSPGAIAAAAFSRAGFASFLPQGIDIGLTALGVDPWFSYTRTTGLSTSNLLFGNPGGDLIDAAHKAVSGITTGHALTEEGSADVYRLLPAQNLLGVSNFVNLLRQSLPSSKE